MVQMLVTIAFIAVLSVSARSILFDLTRPLTSHPACTEDAAYDAMMAARHRAAFSPATPRVSLRRLHQPRRRPLAAAA